MDQVILVDDQDNEIGTMEKIEAHRKGLLHRAFSVLLFNSKGEMLIQKRAMKKYHSAGLWTNACCSHPKPQEHIREASRRRLKEEMGIDLQPEFVYKFIYKTTLADDMIEHECDHVFIGTFDGLPYTNPDEVEAWKIIDLETLRKDLLSHPEQYTYWFRLMLTHDKSDYFVRSK